MAKRRSVGKKGFQPSSYEKMQGSPMDPKDHPSRLMPDATDPNWASIMGTKAPSIPNYENPEGM